MDIYGKLERGNLNLDNVQRFGIGRQDTATGLKVTHACPLCPIGAPAPGCHCCGGNGTLSEIQLARLTGPSVL